MHLVSVLNVVGSVPERASQPAAQQLDRNTPPKQPHATRGRYLCWRPSCLSPLLLQDRDELWHARPELGKARVLYMTSHFMTKMSQEKGGYEYEKVRK